MYPAVIDYHQHLLCSLQGQMDDFWYFFCFPKSSPLNRKHWKKHHFPILLLSQDWFCSYLTLPAVCKGRKAQRFCWWLLFPPKTPAVMFAGDVTLPRFTIPHPTASWQSKISVSNPTAQIWLLSLLQDILLSSAVPVQTSAIL